MKSKKDYKNLINCLATFMLILGIILTLSHIDLGLQEVNEALDDIVFYIPFVMIIPSSFVLLFGWLFGEVEIKKKIKVRI